MSILATTNVPGWFWGLALGIIACTVIHLIIQQRKLGK